jgi:hypothetical protein
LFCGRETWCAQWFCRHDPVEIHGIDPENQIAIPVTRPMNIAMGKAIESFIPPGDKRITHAALWVQVFDMFIGERCRPRGSSLREFHVYFDYVN